MRFNFSKSLFLVIACGMLARFAGCVLPAHGQMPPARQVQLISNLPSISYPTIDARVDQWTVNGRPKAVLVKSNYLTATQTVQLAPKLGGKTVQLVTNVTFTTNALQVMLTNGHAFAFCLPPTPVVVWTAFEIYGLETSTNLQDWSPVGWDARRDPRRYFRVAGTNLVERTPLYLKQITITN